MKYVGKLYGKVGGKYVSLGESVDENSVVVDENKLEFVLGHRCPPTMYGKECPVGVGCLECKMAYLRGDDGE
jgi:hypothetical protein